MSPQTRISLRTLPHNANAGERYETAQVPSSRGRRSAQAGCKAWGNPIGHHDRPMSDAQVAETFSGLAGRKLAPALLQKMLDRAWRIESHPDWTARFDDVRVGAGSI